MNNYKVEKLPKMEKSGFEKWMARLGGPIAAIIFIGKNRVGEIKEGFDFISETKTPEEVLKMREQASSVEDESRIFEEKILLYRKHVNIVFQLQHDSDTEKL